jgi:periplasmic divalent cation tolerance protein
MLIVLTTVPDQASGERLATELVEAGLAGCVQVLPAMTSVYVWEGQVQTEKEHLLLIKTLEERWDQLCEFISANHTYSVPEIVAVESYAVAESYRAWLGESVGASAASDL